MSKKVIFRGLGPNGNAVIDKETVVYNGAIIELEDHIADAYTKTGLAIEIKDSFTMEEAEAMRGRIITDNERRASLIKDANSKKEKTAAEAKGGKK